MSQDDTTANNVSNVTDESGNRIIWVDVETNGTHAFGDDLLLEVAVLVTDTDLNILDPEGYQAVVHYAWDDVLDVMAETSEYVVKMHSETGLWDKLRDGKSLEVIDDEMLAYMKRFVPTPKKARLAGNSITLDRNFLEVNLPLSFDHFHYRSIDVSTVAGLVGYWGTDDMQYEKKTVHSAFSDITESIEELRHLRTIAMKI